MAIVKDYKAGKLNYPFAINSKQKGGESAMAFSEETINEAWRNAGGRCECTRKTCTHHTGRCNAILTRYNKWHAHHKVAVAAGGNDTVSNCEALCIPCHENTIT